MRLNGSYEIRSLKVCIPLIKKDRTMQKEKNELQSLRNRAEVLQEAIRNLSCKNRHNKKLSVREDKTAGLKKRMQDGLYKPDSEKIAAGIISKILLAQTIA